jgi:cytochrome b
VTRVALWDLPTRLVHWALVLLLLFSWWSAEEHHMDWHRSSGYAILALLLFRLIWGVVGSSTARFADFVRGPATVLAHARGKGVARLGHNPLGGWSIVAMLLVLVAQVGLGLFAVDTDGLESGPLSHWVSFDTGRAAAELHEANFRLLQGLIALHIAAVLFYLFIRRDNLIAAMLSGVTTVDTAPGEVPRMAPLGRALPAALIAAGLAWWVSRGFSLAI